MTENVQVMGNMNIKASLYFVTINLPCPLASQH